MASMLWTDSLAVGQPDMDGQHRHLMELANVLNEAMLQNAGEEVLRKHFAALMTYTTLHFTSEERLMAEQGYPAAAQHRKEHERLVLELNRMRVGYAPSSHRILQTLAFLQDWLKEHIDTLDRTLAAFLLERRGK